MKYFAPTKLSENISETPEGFLLCIGVPITRTGEFVYGEGETPLETDADGQLLIYRDEDDVFHAEAIASFEGKPVTINHPTDFVSPSNWSYLAKGVVQNVRRGEGEEKNNLLADLLITDALAISMVKSGLREVSCGYEAEYIQTAEGKGRQTKIIGNHLALVEKGRAGASCAINDHIGKVTKMKTFAEKFKSYFAKTLDVDKSIAAATKDAEMEEKEEKKDESKDEVTKSYDELMKMMKDMSAKIDSMKPKEVEAKDDKESEEKTEKKDEEKKDESKDDESAGEKSMEDRMKSLELAVSKLLEKQSSDADESEESEDSEEEESEDDDFEESSMTGDTASRAEILAPGIEKSKDIKAKALKAAYSTKEGKEVIHALNGGKAPAFDSAEKVETLFIAASEVLKSKRGNEFSDTKKAKSVDSSEKGAPIFSAEEINKRNAAHYGLKN